MTTDERRRLLKQCMDSYRPNFGDEDADSALAMMYTYFRENNKFENEAIMAAFDELYSHLDVLSLKEMDKIINIVCDLCINYERAAFIEGVKLGALLSAELMT